MDFLHVKNVFCLYSEQYALAVPRPYNRLMTIRDTCTRKSFIFVSQLFFLFFFVECPYPPICVHQNVLSTFVMEGFDVQIVAIRQITVPMK